MGHIDKDGFLYVDGRLDDMIVLADGTMVAPEVLERALGAHPAIAQALAYGMPDKRSGQVVLACRLVLQDGVGCDGERAAIDFARSVQTPDGARIEHVEVSCEPLPLSPAGKLLRRQA